MNNNRLGMAAQIFQWEARYDSEGKLRVYRLPQNDGGGSYEVAGINERYDPTMAAKLKRLIEAGQQDDAALEAVEYIAMQTDVAGSWVTIPAAEFFLRDTSFNRGVTGAAKILQMAVRAEPIDGQVGPITRAAIRFCESKPILLLARLRVARESYEREHVGVRENLWIGLANRWDKALEVSVDALFA